MDESGKERRRPKCSRDACSAGRWPDLAGGATDNTNSILTHSTYILFDIFSFFPSIDPNFNPQRLAKMEGLKNKFAQCKKEGRVSFSRMQWQTTLPLHLLMDAACACDLLHRWISHA